MLPVTHCFIVRSPVNLDDPRSKLSPERARPTCLVVPKRSQGRCSLTALRPLCATVSRKSFSRPPGREVEEAEAGKSQKEAKRERQRAIAQSRRVFARVQSAGLGDRPLFIDWANKTEAASPASRRLVHPKLKRRPVDKISRNNQHHTIIPIACGAQWHLYYSSTEQINHRLVRKRSAAHSRESGRIESTATTAICETSRRPSFSRSVPPVVQLLVLLSHRFVPHGHVPVFRSGLERPAGRRGAYSCCRQRCCLPTWG